MGIEDEEPRAASEERRFGQNIADQNAETSQRTPVTSRGEGQGSKLKPIFLDSSSNLSKRSFVLR